MPTPNLFSKKKLTETNNKNTPIRVGLLTPRKFSFTKVCAKKKLLQKLTNHTLISHLFSNKIALNSNNNLYFFYEHNI